MSTFHMSVYFFPWEFHTPLGLILRFGRGEGRGSSYLFLSFSDSRLLTTLSWRQPSNWEHPTPSLPTVRPRTPAVQRYMEFQVWGIVNYPFKHTARDKLAPSTHSQPLQCVQWSARCIFIVGVSLLYPLELILRYKGTRVAQRTGDSLANGKVSFCLICLLAFDFYFSTFAAHFTSQGWQLFTPNQIARSASPGGVTDLD